MKTIPAVVWDALELSAIANGGIGGAVSFEEDDLQRPYCIIGHLDFLFNPFAADHADLDVYDAAVTAATEDGLVGVPNDVAVKAINTRKGVAKPYRRVSWEEYVAERGWVREGAA